jgi:3-phenylpropionate/trans-cinnamate dioxygenase ferredoxin subunit
MAEFRKAATVSEVPPGTMKAVTVGVHHLVLCNTGKGVYAIANECSHDSAPISSGHLDGDQVVCPRHGARFDVSDGSVKAPPAIVGIDTYRVKVDGDNIYVVLD